MASSNSVNDLLFKLVSFDKATVLFFFLKFVSIDILIRIICHLITIPTQNVYWQIKSQALIKTVSNSKLTKHKSFDISISRLHLKGQEDYSDAILVIF